MKKLFLSLIFLLVSLISIQISNAADVTLAWDASTDSTVTGYKLYWGSSSRSYGTPVNVGKVLQYTVTGVPDTNLFWAVTAYSVDSESAFSIELPTYALIPSVSGSGTISPNKTVIISKDLSQVFTMTPAAGYMLSDLKIDGASVTKTSSYTFANPINSHTINAIFAIKPVIPTVGGLKIKQ